MQLSLATYIMTDESGQLPLWQVIGRWTSLFATATILLYPAQDFFLGAWRDIRNRRVGMDIPIVIGLTAAFCGSLVATIKQHGEVYFDSIAMFVLFVLLGRYLEVRARVRSADQLDRLAIIVPQTARRLLSNGAEETIPAVELMPGDRLRVLPGEVLPDDGVILEGKSSFDEAIITGEPLPVEKHAGDTVICGAHNREQPVTISVTAVGADSTAGQVRRLLREASASRPRLALLAERAASWFVLCALAIAGATAAAWLVIDPHQALANTISVLIITCPCALALAAPAANALAMGRFAAIGVLPLRSEAIEAIARADTVALDKTGTLTGGRLDLAGVVAGSGLTEAQALAVAMALETQSEHPVAQALRRIAGGEVLEVSGHRNLPGRGVSGIVEGRLWRLGKADFAIGEMERPDWVERALRQQAGQGRYVVLLADAFRRASRACLR
jgi:Cu2+-exporting ATPase